MDWDSFKNDCIGKICKLVKAEQYQSSRKYLTNLFERKKIKDISTECPNVGRIFKIKDIQIFYILLEIDNNDLRLYLDNSCQYIGIDNGFIVDTYENDGVKFTFKFINFKLN